jgi:hypothetical protein
MNEAETRDLLRRIGGDRVAALKISNPVGVDDDSILIHSILSLMMCQGRCG